jgi:hypothetical protein
MLFGLITYRNLTSIRAQCSTDAIHAPFVAGISGSSTEGAHSVALSGGYDDDVDLGYALCVSPLFHKSASYAHLPSVPTPEAEDVTSKVPSSNPKMYGPHLELAFQLEKTNVFLRVAANCTSVIRPNL